MCGFFGLIDFNQNISKNDVNEIKQGAKVANYRGPDDKNGYYDNSFAVSFNRLSILDINAPSQPLISEDKNLVLVCNGEIYNYKELRNQLSKKYNFKTNLDTEVLIPGYLEWGDELWKKLNGMFSIVLWNKKNKKLIMVRDHVGIKPLHYYMCKDRVYFSSDYNSFFHQNFQNIQFNVDSILSYLSFRYVIGEKTFLKNVFDILPGQKIEFYNNNIKSETYWGVNLENKTDKGQDYYVRNLNLEIESAIKRQLISDVPVGAFVSGGLDSSLILSHMSKHIDNINVFATGIDEKNYSELEYVNLISKELSLNVDKTIIDENIFVDEIPNVLRFRGEPNAIPHETAFYLMSQKMKNKIKVVLSGEGADELFGGYGRLFKSPLDYYKKKIINPFYKPIDHFLERYSWFDKNDKKKFLNQETFRFKNFDDYSMTYLNKIFDKCEHLNYFDKMYYIMLKIHLVNMLNRLDRMTMAFSVEARVPFLDKKLIEYIFQIPNKYKIMWKNKIAMTKSFFSNSEKISDKYDIPKYILKKVSEGRVNQKIIDRKKFPFPFPINKWLSGKLGDFVKDTLLSRNIKSDFIINQKNLSKFLSKKTYDAKEDLDGKKIWMLLNIELWLQEKKF